MTALQDAGWHMQKQAAKDATGVTVGAGMSSTADMAEAGKLLAAGQLRRLSPFFVPRILPSMAAGAISIQYGMQVSCWV